MTNPLPPRAPRRWRPALLAALLGWSAAAAAASPPPAAGAAGPSAPLGLAPTRGFALRLLRAGAYPQAIEVYREIARLTPLDARSQLDLATALGFVQRYEEAVEPVENAMRLRPRWLDAYRAAEIIYQHVNRMSDAFDAVQHAAELGDVAALYGMSVYYQKGWGVAADEDESFRWLERAARAGHVAALRFVVQAYREGTYGREIDPDRAAQWERRLLEAEGR